MLVLRSWAQSRGCGAARTQWTHPHIPTARPWLGRLTVGTQFPFSENLKGRSEDLV